MYFFQEATEVEKTVVDSDDDEQLAEPLDEVQFIKEEILLDEEEEEIIETTDEEEQEGRQEDNVQTETIGLEEEDMDMAGESDSQVRICNNCLCSSQIKCI